MSFPTTETATPSRRNDRMVALLAILRDREEIQLRELAELLGASAATIRRDVAALADQGLLIRTHGGARSAGVGAELPVNLRDGRHRPAKAAIARAAVSELPLGKHAIALTGGTTTAEVLRALHHRHDLTIVTNSVGIALEAANQGQQRVLIAGGILRPSSLELVGSLAEATFKQINVGTAIVGCDGLSVSGGLTTHDDIEAGHQSRDARTGLADHRRGGRLEDRQGHSGQTRGHLRHRPRGHRRERRCRRGRKDQGGRRSGQDRAGSRELTREPADPARTDGRPMISGGDGDLTLGLRLGLEQFGAHHPHQLRLRQLESGADRQNQLAGGLLLASLNL
jgi:DeoR/GlpR family transcriptional regulator of sugar metabolism